MTRAWILNMSQRRSRSWRTRTTSTMTKPRAVEKLCRISAQEVVRTPPHTLHMEAGTSSSSHRRRRHSPTPSNDDWVLEDEDELAPVNIVENVDYVSNDKAEAVAMEKRCHISELVSMHTPSRSLHTEEGTSSSSRRCRHRSPMPSDDDWGLVDEDEPALVNILDNMDYVDNNDAEAAVVERLQRISEREAGEQQQREEEENRFAISQVMAYEASEKEATVRSVKTEVVILDSNKIPEIVVLYSDKISELFVRHHAHRSR